MTVAEKLTAIAENMQKVFAAGKAEGSGGGGKIAVFDLAKCDEYEKIELGPAQTMIKLSDEVPTYDELCGGLYLYCARVSFSPGSSLSGEYIWYLNDGNHLTVEAEAGVAMVEDHMMVLSAAAAEIVSSEIGVQVTHGIYFTPTGLNLSGATGTMYAVLAWGFE